MPIRWKLILAIGLPLLGLLSALLLLDYARLKSEAFTLTTTRATETAQRYAEALDSRLATIAQVARSAAALIELNPDLSDRDLYRILRAGLESQPAADAFALDFLPGQRTVAPFGPEPEPDVPPLPAPPAPAPERDDTFTPVAVRTAASPAPTIARLDAALSPSWDAPRRAWAAATQAREGRWTEPHPFPPRPGTQAVTFALPFTRDGAPRGVAAISTTLPALESLFAVAPTPEVSVFILSPDGAPLYSRIAQAYGSAIAGALATGADQPVLARLSTLAKGDGTALRTNLGPAGRGEPAVVFVARAPNSGWAIIGAVPEADVMRNVYAALRDRLLFGSLFVAVIVTLVLGVGLWIVRPIRLLAKAIGEVGDGNWSASAGKAAKGGDEIGDLSRAFNGMVGKIKEQVDELTTQSALREAVESELRIARSIQASLLPTDFPQSPLFDLFALNAPARYVGGDFFDFRTLDSGELVFTVADVSGKGVPAAMFMAVTRTLLRDLATTLSPAAALVRANAMLLEANPECMFVTLFLARYDPRSGRLTYANAGHPAPLLAPAAPSNSPPRQAAPPTGTVLGAIEGVTYTDATLTLNPGDRLVLFTDGVSEARATSGAFFGVERLAAILADNAPAPSEALCRAVLECVDTFQVDKRHDDVTVLSLRRTA
jgi:sigma-B regulation protein RsbU (phosphoserine phosphatase)